jgi:hypothetical protein
MSLLPEPQHHELQVKAAEGPWGGPTYTYRGAEIRCSKGAHVCGLVMEGHPLSGMSFGVAGTITPLVDLWIEEQRLPDYMKLVGPRAR